MVDFFSLVVWILIIFLILLVVGVALALRTIRAGELPPMDRNQLMWNVEYLMRSTRLDTKANSANGKITVTKDSLVATDVYFKKLPSGNIEVRTGANAGTLGWVLTIVFLLFTLIGGIVMSLVLHFMSRGFAKNEVIPMIFSYHETHGLNKRITTFQGPYPVRY